MLKTTTKALSLFWAMGILLCVGFSPAPLHAQTQPVASEYLIASPEPGIDYPVLLLQTATASHTPTGYTVVRRLSENLVIAYPHDFITPARPGVGWQPLGSASLGWKLTPLAQRQLQSEAKHSWLISGRNWSALLPQLEAANIIVAYHSETTGAALLYATPTQVNKILLPSPWVTYIDKPRRGIQEETKITGQDQSTNRINFVHHEFPTYDGSGMVGMVKEGNFDINDVDLTGRVQRTDRESEIQTQHATVMASIMAGAGNTSWEGQGVATGATLAPVGADTIVLPEPLSFYRDLGAYVQNNSYGIGINNTYSTEAQAFDATLAELPELLIVYSAGNSGLISDSLGTYAGIDGFANLTGNFKQSKNILVVGGSDSTYLVPFFASRGPAYDGRVKPEIVAYSPNGTSDGAALTSGFALLLQQNYQAREGSLPPSSLVKAVLANTADDVALAGLDYYSGYGNLNAYRAMNEMNAGHYWLDTVASGGTQEFTLDVPADAREVRIALAWIDPAANAGDFKALVNDLDLTVISPEAQTLRPWVLNPTANAADLNDPAERKRDTLNNLEQVSWQPTGAGTYTIRVSAPQMAADQSFAVQYFVDTEPLVRWTHPTVDDPLLVRERYYLRWDATPEAGDADLQQSINGGDWVTIFEDLDLQREYYGIIPPDEAREVQYRLVTTTDTYTGDPTRVHPNIRPGVGLACGDSILLRWPSDPMASEYTVYRLGEKYMEPWFITRDTAFFLTPGGANGNFFAVEPILGQSYTDFRSTSIDYRLQGGTCYFLSSFADLDDVTERLDYRISLSSTVGLEELEAYRIHEGESLLLGNVTNFTESSLVFEDTDLPEGKLQYITRLRTTSGAEIVGDTAEVYYVAPNHVLVFPNPSEVNEGIVVLNNFDQTVTFKLISLQGQVVKESELNVYNDYVDTFGLPRGIYHYYIELDDEVISGKVVVH